MSRKPLYRNTHELGAMPTAHAIGNKRVLLACEETPSAVTQIARTSLKAGEAVEVHTHPSMDEHFLFLSGEGVVSADGTDYPCREGGFVLVPAGSPHSLTAYTDIDIITIGVALS